MARETDQFEIPAINIHQQAALVGAALLALTKAKMKLDDVLRNSRSREARTIASNAYDLVGMAYHLTELMPGLMQRNDDPRAEDVKQSTT